MTDPVSAVRSSESSLHAKIDMLSMLCSEQRDDMRTFAVHLRDHATAVHDQHAALRANVERIMERVEGNISDVGDLKDGISSLASVVRGLERIEQSRADSMRTAKTLFAWAASAVGVISTGAGVLAALGLR